MLLSSKYNSIEVENNIYEQWMQKGFFHAKPNPGKEAYSIVIPPPNVTGELHMGHMLNNTIQDVLIRKARMEGKEACWVPGTDHASIATESKVVNMLREQGIKKSDLTREEFMKYAWKWKKKYGGIILEQLKKLGTSCDWNRTSFTMDEGYYKAVIRVFVDLYKKGFIYRGLKIINWDVKAKTTISNEEVLYKENGEISKLYSLKYQIKDSDDYVVIATQRPETIFGDTAIAVNPKDDRFKHLIGKSALVPFINRNIPIIGDDYVEIDFGTGCLKVTPAHDQNDYEIGLRHNLKVIDTIDDNGNLNEKCELPKYFGMERFKARKEVIKDLDSAGILVGSEEFTTNIGLSERTNTVIEPKLSLQWYINMKAISKKAYQVVKDDEILLFPPKFKSTYSHWMENVQDWCISRQLWWGQQIPVYYYGENKDNFVVAETVGEALSLAQEKPGNNNLTARDLQQDSDVLDTWASSWLFPLAVYDGFNDECFDKKTGKINLTKNEVLNYFYPTDTLVTAPDILFFWVARMIIAGYEYTGKMPFKNVYLTGIVRDNQYRKMSKSLGNSPDPLVLIKQYGADAVRTGMLFCSPAGNDLFFDEKLCEQGRNFSNKIWNAFRLVKSWEVDENISEVQNQIVIDWFEARYNQAFKEVEDYFSKFRLSNALMALYKLVWTDFCSWYLEIIKPEYQKPIDQDTYHATIIFFEKLLKILHPFMPFITEEIWHKITKRGENEYLIVAKYPEKQSYDEMLIKNTVLVFELITQIRNVRNNNQISPKDGLELLIKAKDYSIYNDFAPIIKKLANITIISVIDEKLDDAMHFLVNTDEFFIPMGKHINLHKEKEKKVKELKYLKGFLISVNKKLNNERFVNKAPAQVIEIEQKKKADAEAKIKVIEESLTLF